MIQQEDMESLYNEKEVTNTVLHNFIKGLKYNIRKKFYDASIHTLLVRAVDLARSTHKASKEEGEEELNTIMEIIREDDEWFEKEHNITVPVKNGKGKDGYHFVMGYISFNTARQGIWDPKGKRNHDIENEYITALGEQARKQEGHTEAAWAIVEINGPV